MDVPKHSDFYSALSSIDMALSLQSYWLVFIDVSKDYVIKDTGLLGGITNAAMSKLKSLDAQFGGFASTALDTTESESILYSDLGPTPYFNNQYNKQTEKMYNKLKHTPEKLMLLVQGVNLPGDRFMVGSTPLENIGGYIPHPIGGPRQELQRLQVSFLENNASITDLVMRPWMISASYDSLKLAKSSNIIFFKLARHTSGFKVTKRFDFKHAIPVSIDSEDYNYDPTSSITRRTVEFVYRSYTVSDGDDLGEGLLDKLVNLGTDIATKYVSNLVNENIISPLSAFTTDLYTKAKATEYKYSTSYKHVDVN